MCSTKEIRKQKELSQQFKPFLGQQTKKKYSSSNKTEIPNTDSSTKPESSSSGGKRITEKNSGEETLIADSDESSES